jgi:hypothetical protein
MKFNIFNAISFIVLTVLTIEFITDAVFSGFNINLEKSSNSF